MLDVGILLEKNLRVPMLWAVSFCHISYNIFLNMQVEELASLIKDNLSCKHLVLSIEEALINFLQNDTR